jgi:hypothetical protein
MSSEKRRNEAAFDAYFESHPEEKGSTDFYLFTDGRFMKHGPSYSALQISGSPCIGQPSEVFKRKNGEPITGILTATVLGPLY